jgi:protocatechuate 3,4-dioxygenase beta subunit
MSCRAITFSDSNGGYHYTSIFPGRYDDGGYRPAHVHYNVIIN